MIDRTFKMRNRNLDDQIRVSTFATKSFWRRALTAASPAILAASQFGLISPGASAVIFAGISGVLGLLLATGNADSTPAT